MTHAAWHLDRDAALVQRGAPRPHPAPSRVDRAAAGDVGGELGRARLPAAQALAHVWQIENVERCERQADRMTVSADLRSAELRSRSAHQAP